MIENLYDILGIKRDAGAATIRKAYRDKSKTEHPDGGGSSERFDLVRFAHDVLSDAERRKRYDETGEAETTQPDTKEATALNIAIGVVFEVIDEQASWGLDPVNCDLLTCATNNLKGRVRNVEEQVATLNRNAEKLRKIAERFSAREGKINRLSVMIVAQAVRQEQDAAAKQNERELVELALLILSDHAFWQGARSAQYPATTGPMIFGAF